MVKPLYYDFMSLIVEQAIDAKFKAQYFLVEVQYTWLDKILIPSIPYQVQQFRPEITPDVGL